MTKGNKSSSQMQNHTDKQNLNSEELTLKEKRQAYNAERKQRLQQQEMNYLKNSLKKGVVGKPQLPAGDLTMPGLFGKFFGKAIVVIIVILLIVLALAGSILIGVLVGYIATATEVPSALFSTTEETSFLYDSDGKQISALTGSNNINHESVPYQEVADTYISDAFIAIEDRTFKSNIGIDPRRIAGAVITTLANPGGSSYGGSTITQQTVKMYTGDDEVSYQRKVQEWHRAIKLNEQLNKSEIMSLYLNRVPMANNYIGIQSAAKAYFGKEAKDLNLAECALLAGIPKSPASYNPYTELGRRNIQRRQRVVLTAMLENGSITADEFNDALNYELVYANPKNSYVDSNINTYYEEFAIKQVTEDLIAAGYSSSIANNMVQNGGLKIYTALDSKAQKKLDELYNTTSYFQSNPDYFIDKPEVPQGGTILLDNKNNTIIAMQGGYGKKNSNLVFNRATDSHRQPGSSIKPIAVYGPAIELDLISGSTIVKDEPVHMDINNPNVIWPNNAYDGFIGNAKVREHLKISGNVPATKILHELGVDTAKSFLLELGIDLSNDPIDLALATGGLTYGVSPLQMADAFTVFPNGGLYAPAKTYTKVLDNNGNVILENTPAYKQVFSAETAYMTQKLMEEVFRGPRTGVGYNGTLSQFAPITNSNGEAIATSGKTGTSNDFQDEWTVMQTPYYTVSTWFGFDNRIKRSTLENTTNFFGLHHLSYDFLEYIHQDLPAADWVKPAGIVELQIDPNTGFLAASGSGYSYTEYFKADSPITPNRTSKGDYNYLATDAIPNYYRDFAANNGYR